MLNVFKFLLSNQNQNIARRAQQPQSPVQSCNTYLVKIFQNNFCVVMCSITVIDGDRQ